METITKTINTKFCRISASIEKEKTEEEISSNASIEIHHGKNSIFIYPDDSERVFRMLYLDFRIGKQCVFTQQNGVFSIELSSDKNFTVMMSHFGPGDKGELSCSMPFEDEDIQAFKDIVKWVVVNFE